MPASPHISRLKSRPDYLKVARGRRFAARGVVLQAWKRPPDDDRTADVRVGFTATKKTGNAVTRNRIKRRLRAAARAILPVAAKPGYDYVLVGRAATFDRTWQSLLDDLTLALQMVHQPGEKGSGNHRQSGGGTPGRKDKREA